MYPISNFDGHSANLLSFVFFVAHSLSAAAARLASLVPVLDQSMNSRLTQKMGAELHMHTYVRSANVALGCFVTNFSEFVA